MPYPPHNNSEQCPACAMIAEMEVEVLAALAKIRQRYDVNTVALVETMIECCVDLAPAECPDATLRRGLHQAIEHSIDRRAPYVLGCDYDSPITPIGNA